MLFKVRAVLIKLELEARMDYTFGMSQLVIELVEPETNTRAEVAYETIRYVPKHITNQWIFDRASSIIARLFNKLDVDW